MRLRTFLFLLFFFNDTATTEIYTLSLHDALPISSGRSRSLPSLWCWYPSEPRRDRKSTRLNSSHANISYAVFCLKKKTLNLTDDYTDQQNKHKLGSTTHNNQT